MRFISWKYSLKLDLIQHQIGNLMLFEELCRFLFYENENFPFGNSSGLKFVFKLKVFLDGVCYSSVHLFPESNYGIVSLFACNWKSFSSTWWFSAKIHMIQMEAKNANNFAMLKETMGNESGIGLGINIQHPHQKYQQLAASNNNDQMSVIVCFGVKWALLNIHSLLLNQLILKMLRQGMCTNRSHVALSWSFFIKS